MGVPGLWAELAPFAHHTTWSDEAWRAFREHARLLRVGIDAPLWLFHVSKASGGARPQLRALFYRLAKLFERPVEPLFVFDGPGRPRTKRNAVVHGAVRPIEREFRALLDAFAFAHRTAPGEAEAELAWMNAAGIVDAVITDDVDFFVFGGRIALRPTGDDALALYDSSRMGLDRDAFVLVALLSGGDYDTQGMARCGIRTALALARGGYGARLVDAFRHGEQALVSWRADVCAELTDNPSGRLARRMPRLAHDFVRAFPHAALTRVVAQYTEPLTSGVAPRIAGRLDVGELARALTALLGWSPETTAGRLERVFRGLVLRSLLCSAPPPPRKPAAAPATPHRSPVSLITDYFAAVSVRSPPRERPTVSGVHRSASGDIEMVRIVCTCAQFAEQVEEALGAPAAPRKLSLWVHSTLVERDDTLRAALQRHTLKESPRRPARGQTCLTDFFAPPSGDDSVEFVGMRKT